jgi:ABC-type phosphate transport system substrate-binding protein
MRKIRNMSSALKRLTIVVGACTGAAALVVGLAGPASADPGTTYVTVGSDTVQDVENQFAVDFGNGTLGSWDAVNPGDPTHTHDTINPKPGCTMTRPNGSGEGLNALRKSINPSTGATQLALPPAPGCVDFSRSSSGPGGAQSNTGALVYIPFALDAVTTATGPATAAGGALATHITQADKFSVGNPTAPGDLVTLYRDCQPVSVGGVTYDPRSPAAAGNQQIDLYVPQAGSGTRNFWASTLGFDPTTLPSCVHDHSVLDPTEAVQEHDGTIYSQDPNAFGPFSVAQFIAQSNGHNDRRHNVAIHSLLPAPGGTAVAPVVNGTLNVAFPIRREVYNIVAMNRVTAGSPGFDQNLTNLLVGPNSAVCRDRLTIAGFGFAQLTSAPLGHTCGQVAANLRAFDPVSNPV